MRTKCFYYNENLRQFESIDVWKLKELEKKDYEQFLVVKSKLYGKMVKNDANKMKFYLNVSTPHFRRQGQGGNTTVVARGDAESLTHQAFKEAFQRVNEINLQTDNQNVILNVECIETEREVRCNNTDYEVDVCFRILNSDSEYLRDNIGEILNFEIYHTSPVTWKKAQDFRIANELLFEYRIITKNTVYDNVSAEGYYKMVDYYYNEITGGQPIHGVMICDRINASILNWVISRNGNWTASLAETHFTVFEKIKEGQNEMMDQDKVKEIWLAYDGKFINKYENKTFNTIEEAKAIAEYIAFVSYNKK